MLGEGVAGACPSPGRLSHNSRAGHRPQLLLQLQRLRVPYMVRKLHVGDFVWVAQETKPRDPGRGVDRRAGIRGRALGGPGVRGYEPTGPFLVSWQQDPGSSSWTTSWSASGWMTCVAASLMAASVSRRFLEWPRRAPHSLSALGPLRSSGVSGFKAEPP